MFQSIVHMLFNTIDYFAVKDVFRYKRDGRLRRISYNEFGGQVKNVTRGLADMGLQAGDKIAILSNNRPEWPVSDFAVFALRGRVIPIYQTLLPKQTAYILKDSETRAIFVENETQYKKIAAIKEELPGLEFIISYDEISDITIPVIYFHELIEKGKIHREKHRDFFEKSIESIDPEDVCSIVYTSGTTGNPKGVMLSHKGFLIDIINSEAVLSLYPSDVFLSFLPLSHLYERLAGHWCPIYRGGTIHYAQSIETVVEDIADARPTVMVSVPRLYEKVASAVKNQIETGPAFKRNLYYWAVGTGLEYHEKKTENKLTKELEFRHKIADKLVFQKIRNKLGGRFRCPIAGGAPLSVETLKFFEAVGMRIIEGYGMTETHLIITLTPQGKTKYGSCGKPIEGIEVKTAKDGEVLVRGETLMAGYYNNPEQTAEMIDKDGWLHTGDIGHLDKDNYLFLTDRKKNIIVTSGGKNVAPAPIEHKIKISPLIDEACLIGSGRKFISALIIPDYEALMKLANEEGLELRNNKELAENVRVHEIVLEEIDNLQHDFARYEKVKKIRILPEPFSIEKGELTPSLKIKRSVVEKEYKEIIDGIYE